MSKDEITPGSGDGRPSPEPVNQDAGQDTTADSEKFQHERNLPPGEEDSDTLSVVDIGEKLFQWRDYTPLPFIMILLFVAEPSVFSATLGTLLIVAGELIRLYSVAFIGTVSRTRSDSLGKKLVVEGPFSWVRNPLYVGNFFITFGVVSFGGVGWLIVITMLAFAFQYFCIVRYEETLLRQEFGNDYEDYLKTVPAWIPKSEFSNLTKWQWPDSFSPALRSEKRTLTAIVIMLLALVLIAG